MKKKNQLLALGVMAALLAGVFTGCGSTASENIKTEEENITAASGELKEINIGFVDTSGANILLGTEGVARDQGYFEEEFAKIGFKANLVPMAGAGPAINEALAGGSLDIGILGDVPAVNGKANGIDTTVISFSGLNNTVVILGNPDSNIKTVADLKGKKVATQKGAFMHRLLIYILESEGLTIDDIEFVNLPSQDALAALETGSVDAAVTQPGDVTYRLVQEKGYDEVIFSRDHEGWSSGGMSEIRNDFLEQYPETAVAFLTAFVRANEYIESNPDALKEQWIAAGYQAESYDYSYPNHDNYASIEATDDVVANAKNTLKFLQENDLTDGDFDVDAWYDLSYYETAKANYKGE